MKAIRVACGLSIVNGRHFYPQTIVGGPKFDILKKKIPFALAHDAVDILSHTTISTNNFVSTVIGLLGPHALVSCKLGNDEST
jgi:hypothetical protein